MKNQDFIIADNRGEQKSDRDVAFYGPGLLELLDPVDDGGHRIIYNISTNEAGANLGIFSSASCV